MNIKKEVKHKTLLTNIQVKINLLQRQMKNKIAGIRNKEDSLVLKI